MADDIAPIVQEVTLADLVRTLWRRKWALLSVFVLVVGAGGAYTFLQTPQYTSHSTIVVLEQQDIVLRWLESRQAAMWVGERLGDPLLSTLFPGDWSAASGNWVNEPPTPEAAGRAIASSVTVTTTLDYTTTDRTLQVQAILADPGLARDVANAYLDSLEVILPTLQNVTESVLFQQFYDGQNSQDARRQAHEVALEREYWIVLDPAYAAQAPSSPNVTLNLALSAVLGLLLGVFAAFTAQWISNYRVSSRPPAVPLPPSPGAPGGSGAAGPGASYRYRGK